MDLKLVALPLYEARGWMKVIGVVMVTTALAIVGAFAFLPFGWGVDRWFLDLVVFLINLPPIMSLPMVLLPIWPGVLLCQAAGRIKTAVATDDERSLHESLAKLKTFFVMQCILYLIWLGAVAFVAVLFYSLSF